ncbi:MAG: S9 family peptidase [Bryobacterales bacterium]|nr:S9 family peptidase [Bryobacterales bacterium]
MRRIIPLLYLLLSTVGYSQQKPWDIEAIRSISVPSDPQISPDATSYAYTYQGKVFISSLLRNELRSLGLGSRPRWSPDGKYLAYIAPDGQVHTSDNRTLTRSTAPISSYFITLRNEVLFSATDPDPKPDPIVIGHPYRYTRIYRQPVSGDPTLLTKRTQSVVNFAVHPDGSKIAYAVQRTPLPRDAFHVDLYELDLSANRETPLVTQPGRDADPCYSPDGRTIAFHTQGGTWNYFEARHVALIPSGGGPIRLLTQGLPYDVFRNGNIFAWSPDSKEIVYTAGRGAKDVLLRQDIAIGKVTVMAERISGAASLTRDLKHALFLKLGISRPAEIAWLNPEGEKQVTHFHDSLAAYPRIHAQVIQWKSHDGTEVEGVLWMPINYKPHTRFPLLVDLHGGPTGVTLDAFPVSRTYPIQAFLQAGFGVLSPNFRGSSNYGAAFRLKNALSQGVGDYQDVMSGVDYLITEGYADPDRLGVFGWSYGGYLTGAVISQTNRFKAASIGAPATDWTTYYGQFDGSKEVLWTYFGGSPWDVPENYNRHSYRNRLKNIRTPTLLQVGALDYFNHNADIYQALTDNNVPVEYVLYPREPHGFTEPAHQKDLMERNLRWFQRVLNP